MRLFKRSKWFAENESGAVTVDWVVLTAALVGLAVGAMLTVRGGTMQVADRIAHVLGTHVHAS